MGIREGGPARTLLFSLVLILSVTVAGPAAGQEGPVDMLSQYDIRLDGAATSDSTGEAIDGGGDVNNDGTPDFLVGATQADNNTRQDSGSVYVVFGDPADDEIDLASLGADGFRIDGPTAFLTTGNEASFAGDVNNDGLEDIVVGESQADNNTRTNSGSAWVIFGKATTTNVDLANVTTEGFRIDGALAGDVAGTAVSGGGDVNNDGLDDVVVGAPAGPAVVGNTEGSAYVVFGKATTTNVDLASLGAGGFRIQGEDSNDVAGYSVSSESDVNNDGLADVVVGAFNTDYNMLNGSGSAYVVFGKATTTLVDLSSLGAGGYRIDGAGVFEHSADRLATGGDINDDGLDDVVMAGWRADNGAPGTGSAYVVFGKATTTNIALGSLGNAGFRIDGASADDFAGMSIDTGGDVDDDGLADVLVGATQTDIHDRVDSGSVYVVFGRTATTTINLGALGSDGFRIDGAATDDTLGRSVANAGDVNDDGLDDVLMSANGADNNGRSFSGSAYVDLVADWLPGACANPRSGTDGADTLIGGVDGDDISGGDGGDILHGEEGDDCLLGQGGDDELFGGGDADDLEGGDNADTLEGENGGDTLEGNGGGDTVEGGDGDDEADGNDGEDTIEGQDNQDDLSGGKNADTVKGQAQADDLEGNKGGDTLKGGDGGDTITGGDGQDTIEGGGGNDDIFANDGEVDTIDCGSGADTVNADGIDVLTSC